ncbi:MAG: hypothetical protein PHS99_06840 [Candidatus Marinimicrobia bacterium]|nr:hypothetical protein [Candidatus Neomarinimicrobiota bacterium]
MIEHISEYILKPDYRQRFELLFGPGGQWDKLFSRCEGYKGTTVLRDTENPNRLLIFDLWTSVEHRIFAIKTQEKLYSNVELLFQEWAVSKTDWGIFKIQAESSVRSRPKKR